MILPHPFDFRGRPGRRAGTGPDALRRRLAAPERAVQRTGGGLPEMRSGDNRGFAAAASGEGGGASRDRRTASEARHASGDEPRRLRVVIVEDEAVISMELEDMLHECGVDVVGIAHDAEQALRLVQAERPDLVTMDINLPGPRDGISAAEDIFQRYGLRSLFISAYSDPETMARAQSAHPVGWLAKPLSRRALASALEGIDPDPEQP